MSDQVYPITPSQALNLSLNSYYDLLKNQMGGLQANEYLQLKLVADPVDIGTKYPWYSQYNLLRRCDVQIEPNPVSDGVFLNAGRFVDAYQSFLEKLCKYVAIANLTQAQQDELSALRLNGISINKSILAALKSQRSDWNDYCDATGTSRGDIYAFNSWKTSMDSNQQDIDNLIDQLSINNFKINQIQSQVYPDPEDKTIVDTDTAFRSSSMFLRYPCYTDDTYLPVVIDLAYLTNLPASPSAQFDNRHAITWNTSIDAMLNKQMGAFSVVFDKNSSSSNSINTDWSVSGSVSYAFISVSASASESTKIQEDFNSMTGFTLAAKSAFRSSILYPGWFQPNLFECKHVKNNLDDFAEFIGPTGSLLYYPTGIILVRGFSVEFENTQNWTYDYQHSFSASAGGGFSFCGIDFGGSQTYGSNQHEHSIDQSQTKLTIVDDETTIRFVGYAVYKNTVWNKKESPVTEPGLDANVKR
jgi:hypothetical protein